MSKQPGRWSEMRVTIIFGADLLNRVRAAASAHGLSAFVREAVERELARRAIATVE